MKAWKCWITSLGPDFGVSVTLADTREKAKSRVALSAFDAGYLKKASPHLITAHRCPEHDSNPHINAGACVSPEYLQEAES